MRTRLIELMALKQGKERRRITPTEVADETGISRNTIYKWLNDDITRFDERTIVLLCQYFECQIGELLYIDIESTPC